MNRIIKATWIMICIVIVIGILYFSFRKNDVTISKDQTLIQENKDIWSLPLQDLPPIVEEKRQRIARAAHDRDYKQLATLADDKQFTFSFGADDNFENFLYEEDERGDKANEIIPLILSLRFEKVGNDTAGYTYYWPYIFRKNVEDWTEADIEFLKIIISEEQIKQSQEYGIGYIWYRIAIQDDGRWTAYVAGD